MHLFMHFIDLCYRILICIVLLNILCTKIKLFKAFIDTH